MQETTNRSAFGPFQERHRTPRTQRLPVTFGATLDAGIAFTILFLVLMRMNWASMPTGAANFLAMRVSVANVLSVGGFLLAWSTIFRLMESYSTHDRTTISGQGAICVKASTIGSTILLLFQLISSTGVFNHRFLFQFWLLVVPAEFFSRLLAMRIVMWNRRRKRSANVAVIVGTGPRARELYRTMRNHPAGDSRIVGFVDNGLQWRDLLPAEFLGDLNSLEQILMRQQVDEVLVALPVKSAYSDIQTAIGICERLGVDVKYPSDVFRFTTARTYLEGDLRSQMVALRPGVQDRLLLGLKRMIDFVAALCALIGLFPLLIVIAMAVKVTSRGPALFIQERVGRNRRRFRMYKFRTMSAEAERIQDSLEALNEAKGPVFKMRHDPRITRIGGFLRKTSMDELPQLFNVLRGEMSLVGPRPLPLRDVARIDDAAVMRRFRVRPGLTCLWQIAGRSNTDFSRWIELDLEYIDHWSLALDFHILLRTIPVLVKGTGAM